MELKRKLWWVTIKGGITYAVVAKDFDEAVYLIKTWRDNPIISIKEAVDTTVITEEDINETIKEREEYETNKTIV